MNLDSKIDLIFWGVDLRKSRLNTAIIPKNIFHRGLFIIELWMGVHLPMDISSVQLVPCLVYFLGIIVFIPTFIYGNDIINKSIAAVVYFTICSDASKSTIDSLVSPCLFYLVRFWYSLCLKLTPFCSYMRVLGSSLPKHAIYSHPRK